MIWLILSILCSSGVAILLRYASLRRLDQFPIFVANYGTALVLGLALAESARFVSEPSAGVALAMLVGIFYVFGLLVFRRAINEVGTGIAASVSRLSVILPVALSILGFGESLGVPQFAGIGLAVLVLPFSGRYWPPWNAPPAAGTPPAGGRPAVAASGLLWTVALFLVFGLNDSALKIRAELIPASDPGLFFAILFGTAGIISVVITIVRREVVKVESIVLGVLLGAVNYGTAHFLARALGVIPGYQAFTLNSVGIILLVTLLGRLLFGERLARHNMVFLLGSVLAIVLLRLP
jgi:drug/metabolite transporter (DMT)-like permease